MMSVFGFVAFANPLSAECPPHREGVVGTAASVGARKSAAERRHRDGLLAEPGGEVLRRVEPGEERTVPRVDERAEADALLPVDDVRLIRRDNALPDRRERHEPDQLRLGQPGDPEAGPTAPAALAAEDVRDRPRNLAAFAACAQPCAAENCTVRPASCRGSATTKRRRRSSRGLLGAAEPIVIRPPSLVGRPLICCRRLTA